MASLVWATSAYCKERRAQGPWFTHEQLGKTYLQVQIIIVCFCPLKPPPTSHPLYFSQQNLAHKLNEHNSQKQISWGWTNAAGLEFHSILLLSHKLQPLTESQRARNMVSTGLILNLCPAWKIKTLEWVYTAELGLFFILFCAVFPLKASHSSSVYIPAFFDSAIDLTPNNLNLTCFYC
jgi:hypothetical protein